MSTQSIQQTTTSKVPRNKYYDLVRVIAILLLVPFHANDVFKPSVLNIFLKFTTPPEPWLWVFHYGILYWQIPALFIIAGFSMRMSLMKRTPKEFLKDRCIRILVPAAFIVFVILPLSEVFTGIWQLTVGHAWFLIDLFIFSAIMLKIKKVPDWILYITPFVALITPDFLSQIFDFLLFMCGFAIDGKKKLSRFYLVLSIPAIITGQFLLSIPGSSISLLLLIQTLLSLGIVGSFSYEGKVPFEKTATPYFVIHTVILAWLSRAVDLVSWQLYLFLQLAIPINLVLGWLCTKNKVTRFLTGSKA